MAIQGTFQYDMGGLTVDVRRNRLEIYVASHCSVCQYSHEVAVDIRHCYPHVSVKLIDVETTSEAIPDEVFATPTYLLDGRVWSLGNPSEEKIRNAFGELQDGE